MSSGGLVRSIALPARAKLNLDLEVACRRPDGMHELRTHMQAVDLHDLLIAAPAEGTSLSTSGLELAKATTNSVLRAHEAVESAIGRKLPTNYSLHKRIPPGSGLGGASSDAAAAMRALRQLYGLSLELKTVAVAVGADVTFFLTGGTARVEGIGDRVMPVQGSPGWYAIAWPGIELSTASVYRAWDEVGGDGANQLRRAAARVNPSIDEFAKSLGVGWQMTGSGSAFFRPCADRAAAEAAVRDLGCWTVVTSAVGAWAE